MQDVQALGSRPGVDRVRRDPGTTAILVMGICIRQRGWNHSVFARVCQARFLEQNQRFHSHALLVTGIQAIERQSRKKARKPAAIRTAVPEIRRLGATGRDKIGA